MLPSLSKVTASQPLAAQVMLLKTIEIGAIVHNYHAMQAKTHKQAVMAPPLKADAYGLGLEPVARALHHRKCQAFFMATLEEALRLRSFLEEAEIFVLAGYTPGTAEFFLKARLTPVLISASQVKAWIALEHQENRKLPAVLHVDTGMGRTGLTKAELQEITPLLKDLFLRFVMSHYVNSEDPDHPMNTAQLEALMQHRALFPHLPFSLANSHAFLLPSRFHGQWVRPGIALGGLCPLIPGLRPAVSIQSRIVQIKWLPKGHPVGYNSTYVTSKPCRVATVALGYADGLRRLASNCGMLKYGLYSLPIIGRVSMDFVTVDVTHVPTQLLEEGEWVTLFDDAVSAQELARTCGTTIYELQVTLGLRAHKQYV